ncbi:MAG TPA: hypothetical protein VMW74_07280 [Nitrosopumilaceae archaeon]|nr:hypothetical protein [Nitrosopumilaceae archaeon]
MPKITPPEIILKVIFLTLNGFSRQEINNKTDVSLGKISDIWKTFATQVGEANFDALKILGQFLRSKDTTITHWPDEFRIRQRLEKAGVSLDEFDAFVADVFIVCAEARVDASAIIKAFLNLKTLAQTNKIPLEQVNQYFTELYSKVENLKKAHVNFTSEITTAKKQKDTILEENKTTLKILDDYINTKKELKNQGISTDDLKTITKIFSELQKANWSTPVIMKHLTEETNYDSRISKKQRIEKDLDNRIEQKSQMVNELNKEITNDKQVIARSKARVKVLKKQEIELIESLTIRKNLFVKHVESYDRATRDAMKLQQTSHQAFMNNLKGQITEELKTMFSDKEYELSQMFATVDRLIASVASATEQVSSLKIIKSLYNLLALNSGPVESRKAMILVVESFEIVCEENHDRPAVLQAQSMLRFLKGELKRLSQRPN